MTSPTQSCFNCQQIFYQQSLLPLECIDFLFGGQQISLIGCYVEAPVSSSTGNGPKICQSCLDQLRTSHPSSKRTVLLNRDQQRPAHVCVTCGQLSSASNTLNMRLTVVNVNGRQIHLEQCFNAFYNQDIRIHKYPMICLACLSVIAEDYANLTTNFKIKEEFIETEVECKQEPELHIESVCDWSEITEKTDPSNAVFAEPLNDRNTNHECFECLLSYPTARQLNYHRRTSHQIPKTAKQKVKVNKYECVICQTIYRRKAPYQRHLRTHRSEYQPTSYECYHCDYKVQDKHEMRCHLTMAHFPQVDQRKCPLCSGIFKITGHRNDYKQHILEHEANDNLQCEGCKKKFAKVDSYMQHVEKQIYLFACTRCDGVAYHTVDALEKHMEIVHNHSYTCNHCKLQFSRSGLELHMRNKHGVKKQARCRHCAHEFATNEQLLVHRELMHSALTDRTKERRMVVCHKCGKKFGSKYRLSQHLLYTHGDSNIKCEQCEQVFKRPKNLKEHIDNVHLKIKSPATKIEYPCSDCARTFEQRSKLNNHMRMHTGVVCYDCKGCGMTSSRHSMMQAHMKECDQMTPEVWAKLEKLEFPCQICEVSFSRKSQLVGHMMVHDLPELRPFKCSNCDKGFSSKKNLRKHRNRICLKKQRV